VEDNTMKLIGTGLILGLAALTAASVVACSSGPRATNEATTAEELACVAAATGLEACTQNLDGCVECVGNLNGLCSKTEAAFVNHDIAKGIATKPGADPVGSCYDCLWNNGCLDDTVFGDTGYECDDTGLTTGTALECHQVVNCILGSSCAQSDVATCYCGTGDPNTTCWGDPAAVVNGACHPQIARGNGFTAFAYKDGTDNITHIYDTDRAAGRADQIFACALTNACTACLQ
jgi:hypothetical protein